ncbi:MAG: DUF1049 domain-containing protein [Burkholderiales bacterium]|nr:MAG: DUF1049 domain-containing protein [Burkholderiales bacterium]
MKYLMWLLKAAIFFVLFAFALNNQEPVTLHWFFGARSQAPMVLVLLVTLVLGVALGVLVMLPLWWRARRPRPLTAPGAAAETSEPPATAARPLHPAPDVEPAPAAAEPRHGV